MGETLKEQIKLYEELKANKNVIHTIDANFFFKFVDNLIENYESKKGE